jgi:hypothetical protein
VSSGWLATWLDVEMLAARIGGLPPPHTPDRFLPVWDGQQLEDLLGSRRLCRYVTPTDVGAFTRGSTRRHWVTPTPYSPDEATSYLTLPNPLIRRTHVLLLDPAEIELAVGPKQIVAGAGIEFLLPRGFPSSAVLNGWEMEVR